MEIRKAIGRTIRSGRDEEWKGRDWKGGRLEEGGRVSFCDVSSFYCVGLCCVQTVDEGCSKNEQ